MKLPLRPLSRVDGVREHVLADAGLAEEQDLRVGAGEAARAWRGDRQRWARRSAPARAARRRPRCIASSSACVHDAEDQPPASRGTAPRRRAAAPGRACGLPSTKVPLVLSRSWMMNRSAPLDARWMRACRPETVASAIASVAAGSVRRGRGRRRAGGGRCRASAAPSRRCAARAGCRAHRRCRPRSARQCAGTSRTRPRRGTVRLMSFSSLVAIVTREDGPARAQCIPTGPVAGPHPRKSGADQLSAERSARRRRGGVRRAAADRLAAARLAQDLPPRTPLRRGGWWRAARRAARAPRRRCDPRAKTGRRRAWCVARASPRSTMSASEPTAIVPLRGYMPNSRAALVDVSATKRSSESRPVVTPSV